eukprot:NODE_320_length_1486_cov_91.067502_g231_i0.p2 GENE.NODE_320_length_1486_cov_91.067502_g231_i0~~NODE_320_length_1486_cov_91.067502_g231_i0.p2  ORF type:complete len:99 (+),score=15.42 NODE_320_length_1486_cov_91.067502_g231_i0:596-892(+)
MESDISPLRNGRVRAYVDECASSIQLAKAYVYIYIYIYIYVYLFFVYINMYIYICIDPYTYVYAYTYAYISMYVFTSLRTGMCVCMYVSMCVYHSRYM